ncbi:MAG: lytic transglycosylase domain-containing protein, partial [Rhodospirillaceae bacterium]|nr:lytic transglycosylase domain-containing protein [Rhodospirillaceae bacterium]
VMPTTAKTVARSVNMRFSRDKLLQDPNYNMVIGQTYLASLIEQFKGSYVLALAAYNAGPNRAKKWIRNHGDPRDEKIDTVDWIEMIPFNETRDYVQRVIGNLHVYRQKLTDKRFALNVKK